MKNQLQDDLQTLEVLDDERVFVGTVHSFCIGEVILPFQQLYNLKVPTPLRIASWEETLEATKQAMIEQSLVPPQRKRDLEDITRELNNYRRLYWDSDQKDFPESSTSSISMAYPKLNWAQFEKDYSMFLWQKKISVDFVHLEIETLKTIQSFSLVRKTLSARYKWWIIDEYQDLGILFHQMMLCLLRNTNSQVLAIGDPDQCIYEELQGSKPTLIYELSKAIQEQEGGNLLKLTTNYRSTQKIIDLSEIILERERGYLANRQVNDVQPKCVSYNLDHPSLQFNLLKELLQDLVDNKGLLLEQIAILHPHREGYLALNEISYMLEHSQWPSTLDKDPDYDKVRGTLITWIKQLAKWCTNSSITSRPYFIDLVPMWVELIEHYQERTILEERFRYEKHLFTTLWHLRDTNMKLSKWLNAIDEKLQLNSIIKSYEAIRPDDAKAFFNLCEEAKGGRRLPKWDITRFAQAGRRIQLTTLHSSKGSQFEAVIVAGFDRIGFGKRKSPPKELDKRLAYVGLTRAKKYLFLLHSDSNAYFVSKLMSISTQMVKFLEYDGSSLRSKKQY